MKAPVEKTKQDPIAVALTGASGIQYGLRLIECLLDAQRRVYLMASQAAQVVVNMETDLRLPGRPEEMQAYLSEHFGAQQGQLEVFGRQQWTAPVASGSNPPEAVVICPCTTGTLASVAMTWSKCELRATAHWPLPVPQSQARSCVSVRDASQSNSADGYCGLKLR